MKKPTTRLALLFLGSALVACGDRTAGDGDNAPVEEPEPESQAVEVVLDDYLFVMPSTLPAGEITLEIYNVGIEEHDMMIASAIGVPPIWRLPARLPPGASTVETFTLEAGTYQVLCEFAGHIGRGMMMTLTVE